jgi:hypothetical protein
MIPGAGWNHARSVKFFRNLFGTGTDVGAFISFKRFNGPESPRCLFSWREQAGDSGREYLTIYAAGMDSCGHPISTTHPGPGTMVNRKPCSLVIAATRFSPIPNPDVLPALLDR